MKFDAVLTNPPFQDTARRGRTPHKLWIEFTETALNTWLKDGGTLGQVSPSSFRSPSNRVLTLMKGNQLEFLSFDTGGHFRGVGSSFAHYVITKAPPSDASVTFVTSDHGDESKLCLDDSVMYIPNVLTEEAWEIHRRVVFESSPKLPVEWDYVTCHNIRLKRDGSLSREKTDTHVYPVFHTNRQIWWSVVRQSFAADKKIMWSRSGYTKPFFDNGHLGCTDMGYFVRVQSESEGECLAHNLNLSLMTYIYKTAKWSGFGNELVFRALPALPKDRKLTNEELFASFSLSREATDHVIATVG